MVRADHHLLVSYKGQRSNQLMEQDIPTTLEVKLKDDNMNTGDNLKISIDPEPVNQADPTTPPKPITFEVPGFVMASEPEDERELKVRLDKWLWAARFFKTRALARAAVESGKVFYNGQRAKPSREIQVGASLQIRQGRFEKSVLITGLSTRRRSAQEATELFEETHPEGHAPQHHDHQSNWYPESSSYPSTGGQSPQFYEKKPRKSVRFLRRSNLRQQDHQDKVVYVNTDYNQ